MTTPQIAAGQALLDWLDKSFAEPVIAPVTYRAFRPHVVAMMEQAESRAVAAERIRLREAVAMLGYLVCDDSGCRCAERAVNGVMDLLGEESD